MVKSSEKGETYSSGGASAYVVGEPGVIRRRSLQNDSLDLADSRSSDGDSRVGNALVWVTTTTESIIEDLSTLYMKKRSASVQLLGTPLHKTEGCICHTYLRVTNEDKLSAGAPAVEAINSASGRGGTLLD